METQLAAELLSLSDAYGKARGLKETTIGRLCAGDGRFFSGIRNKRTTFTIRKRDEVVRWFSMNWPEGTAWPDGIDRPESCAAGEGDAA